MTEYTSKDIRVLEEMEHIRLTPGMYIGTTENPVHLVEESLDNALDEVLAGYATAVTIHLDTKNHVYSVLDNGRGIPFDKDIPIIISTKLFSGAKFQDNKTAYKISSGLHGVGLVAVNALSSIFSIEIYRDKKYAKFDFENGKLKYKSITSFEGARPFSTKLQFTPAKKTFESLIPDIERIRRRLVTAAAEIGDKLTISLTIDDDKNPEIFKMNLEDYFKKYCVSIAEESTPLVYLNSTIDVESFNIMFSYSFEGSAAPRIFSSVNLLPVDSGGTHINSLIDLFKDFFATKAKKMDVKFQPNDCLTGLRCYTNLRLIKPTFSGQSKDKLTNSRIDLEKFIKILRNEMENYFTKNPDQLETLLTGFENYRRKLESKKLKTVGNGKRSSTKFTKLRDCISRNGELFIVEGDSAAGSLIQARNPSTTAIFPLKGKIPNVSNAKDILKNKEVSELIQSLGTGVEPHFSIDNLRYDKIICATDADPDGSHIACLLTMVIAILVPEIIKQGKFFIAQTPLFAINEGKTFIPLWNEKDVKAAMENKKHITRFKGLGELNPAQLKTCLIDKTRKLIPISFTKDIDKMVKLFSDVEEKRQLLLKEI